MMASSIKWWLEALLLEEYLSTMEESGYDTLEKCAYLTDAELDKIGVTLPGHKLRILKHLPQHGCTNHLKNTETFNLCDTANNDDDETSSPSVLLAQSDNDDDDDDTGISLPAMDVVNLDRPVPQPRQTVRKKPIPAPRKSRLVRNLNQSNTIDVHITEDVETTIESVEGARDDSREMFTGDNQENMDFIGLHGDPCTSVSSPAVQYGSECTSVSSPAVQYGSEFCDRFCDILEEDSPSATPSLPQEEFENNINESLYARSTKQVKSKSKCEQPKFTDRSDILPNYLIDFEGIHRPEADVTNPEPPVLRCRPREQPQLIMPDPFKRDTFTDFAYQRASEMGAVQYELAHSDRSKRDTFTDFAYQRVSEMDAGNPKLTHPIATSANNTAMMSNKLVDHNIRPLQMQEDTKQVLHTNPLTTDYDVQNKYEGFLYKTGNNPKSEFLRRWCVLAHGRLTYYENDKTTIPKNVIDQHEMLSVGVTTNVKFNHTFELATISSGRVYLFACESGNDFEHWLHALAKNIAQITPALFDTITDFDRAGRVYIKKGTSEVWITSFMLLKANKIFYYTKDQNFEEVDLRKAKISNLLDAVDCSEGAHVAGPVIALSIYQSKPGLNTLYIQADIAREITVWFRLLQQTSKACGDHLDNQPLTADDIPVIVDKCINFLSLYGLQSQGIYRLNGQHSKVTKLMNDFYEDPRGVTLRSDDVLVHEVATLLKRFFRNLSDPVMTADMYTQWITTASIAEHGMKLQWYQYLIKELPTVNQATLKKLIIHLRRVTEFENENKMGSTNIASIFGPLLLSVNKEDDFGAGFAVTSQEIAVFKDLLDYYEYILDIGNEDIEHEVKIEQARRRIDEILKNSTDMSKTMNQEMLLPIYMHNVNELVCTMTVTDSMTAGQLFSQIKPKLQLEKEKQYALFECICNGELERPLRDDERILPVVLRWTNWPKDICKDNMLCIKANYVSENIQLVFDPQSSLFSELRYCEKKSFKKYCFEFSQMKMSFRRDSRATSFMGSWRIEDLTVYVGVQKKRSPPTPFGFSFIPNDAIIDRSWLGHSICCSSREELYRWLAALLGKMVVSR